MSKPPEVNEAIAEVKRAWRDLQESWKDAPLGLRIAILAVLAFAVVGIVSVLT